MAAVVLVALALSWWRLRPPPPEPQVAGPADSTVMRLYREGRTLLDAGRPADALPRLAAAVEGRPDVWQTHYSYGVAVMGSLFRSRTHLGLEGPAMRSSFERVRLARQALEHLAIAESLAVQGGNVARARRLAAQVLGAWGFPWDGFIGYRSAQVADPAWEEPRILGDHLMRIMRDPTSATPAAGSVPGSAPASRDAVRGGRASRIGREGR